MTLEVLAVNASGEIRRRLLDMGLVKGSFIRVIRKAPLGDPIEVELNGFLLTLRLEEAKTIHVKRLEKNALPFIQRHCLHDHGRRWRHNWFHRFFKFSGNS
jgi:Fe2+ transport system protein FeoA